MNTTDKKLFMELNKIKPQDYKTTLGQKALNNALLDLTPNAFKLFVWFHTIPKDKWIFKPEGTAKALGVSIRTMQYAKKEMIDKDYLWIDHEKRRDHYYIGPERVKAFKKEYQIPFNRKTV